MQIALPNINQVEALMQEAVNAFPAASKAARVAVAGYIFEQSLGYLQEIYDQPDTEDYVGGDYVGPYLRGGRFIRSGALKSAETLLNKPTESVITTRPGLVQGVAGAKKPEDYIEVRSHNSRPAGAYFRERALEDGEGDQESMERGEIAFVDAMPAGTVKR